MDKMKQNYYGSLCTELYELLHKEAPRDELDLKQKEMLTPEGRLIFAFNISQPPPFILPAA